MSDATPERLRWAVEVADIRPNHSVLEIGCGGGHAVSLIAATLRGGRILAIDRSATQVALAKRRNAALIADERVEVRRAMLEQVAAGDERYDRVIAVNVNAFWTEPARALPALAALLVPRGRACIVYQPPSPRGIDKVVTGIAATVDEHGLQVMDTPRHSRGTVHLVALILAGRRAPSASRK